MGKIRLTRGLITVVDDEDLVELGQNLWHASKSKGGAYARRCTRSGKTIYLHRQITRCPEHMEVHHIDGNTLNNHRWNLKNANSVVHGRKSQSKGH